MTNILSHDLFNNPAPAPNCLNDPVWLSFHTQVWLCDSAAVTFSIRHLSTCYYSSYLSGEAQQSLWHPLKQRQAVSFPWVSVHEDSSLSPVLPSTTTVRVRWRRRLGGGVGEHLPDRWWIELNVEVGWDFAALGDIEESEADEERFHLRGSRGTVTGCSPARTFITLQYFTLRQNIRNQVIWLFSFSMN